MRSLYLLCLLPTLAFAECPTGADLATGIRAIDSDGASDTFTRTGEHLVESQYRFEPGEGARSLLAQGIYLVMTQDISGNALVDGTRATYSYPLSAGEMPTPTPGGSWTADVVTYNADGFDTTTHSMSFGEETRFVVAECDFAMIPIEVRYSGDDGELLYYLPELGIALLGGFGIGANRDLYRYTRIERVAQ